MRALLLLGLAAALPSVAAAQSPPRSDSSGASAGDAWTVETATVTVTAARLPLALADAPARVTVLTRGAIDATASASVAALLDARAPVVVRRYGPSGLATLSLRGSGASQTLVLLDGVPLASPALGAVDLSLVPTALVETAEVLSGGASGLWGSSAVGGVVALTSGAAPGVRATAEAGPWGGRRASMAATVRAGRLAVFGAGETAASADDYRVADGFGGQAPRLGWDARRTSALAGVAGGTARTSARLVAWASSAERGLGGDSVGAALVGQRQWDRTARLMGSATTHVGRLRLDATAGADASRLRWAAPFPAAGRTDAVDDTGRTQTLHGDLRATAGALGGTWTALVAAGRGHATHPSLADGATDAFAAAALSGDRCLGAVRLFPTLRVDRYAPAGRAAQAAVSPHIGLNATLSPTLSLKASAGRAFRMPTLNDRFWSPGGRPDLRPERALAADAGLAWTRGDATAEVTAFGRTARDEIVWAPGAGGIWSPENVARTRALGVEASASATRRLGDMRLDVGTVATALHARDVGTDQPLRYQPAWTARAWGALARGIARLDLGVRAVGSRPTTASGSQPLPAYAVVDAGVRVAPAWGRARIGLGLTLDNLLDARYESVRLYTMPPRHVRLRLTVTTR